MLQQERLHRIRALLSNFKNISTERIMKELNISRETARRDIIELEAMGEGKRVHGGIVAIEPVNQEAPLTQRYQHMAKEKRSIVRKAVELLQPGQSIFIDAGSTTSMLAEELRTMSGLTIITNSIQAVMNLTLADENESPQHEIILIGGRIFNRPQTQGDFTIAEIQKFTVDIALLSPVGLSANFGASSFYSEEALIAQSMSRRAKQTFILADSSKIGVSSRICYASCQEINTIISNDDIEKHPEFESIRLKNKNIEIHLCHK